jgi:hypothetical protein
MIITGLRELREQLEQAIAALERLTPVLAAWQGHASEVQGACGRPAADSEASAPKRKPSRPAGGKSSPERRAQAARWARERRARKAAEASTVAEAVPADNPPSEPVGARPGQPQNTAARHSDLGGRNGAGQPSIVELCAPPAIPQRVEE